MMDKRQVRRVFTWKRVIAYFLLFLLLALAAYVTAANVGFYGAVPAELPCRNCSGEARSVNVGGFDLYVRELGRENAHPPVVILHGGPGHSSQSFKQGFDFLADEYRVVYYDQRGSGNSQIVPDSTAYSIEQLVEELEALRRDVIGAEKMVVVGHSAGGALAQRYALKYAEHVDRLILVSSIQINNGVAAPFIFDRMLPALFMLSGWPPSDPQARDQWFAHLNETSSLPRLYDPANASLLENSGYISFATWREVSRSLEGDDFQNLLRQMPAPTLVMYGAADGGYTGEAVASGMCDLLPNCTLARFEKSGHWPFLEEPDQFSQKVRNFLADE